MKSNGSSTNLGAHRPAFTGQFLTLGGGQLL
jgi:hypothetical protein